MIKLEVIEERNEGMKMISEAQGDERCLEEMTLSSGGRWKVNLLPCPLQNCSITDTFESTLVNAVIGIRDPGKFLHDVLWFIQPCNC